MIRLRALNEESSEESQGEEDILTVTKEAQEQAAFTRYNTALSFLREKKITEAKEIFQELLNSEFLIKVSKEDCSGQPSVVLKYSCLKNMGAILEQHDKKEALQHYLEAAELDSTDVHLWLQVGMIAIKMLRYEFACEAFLEGLRCSPRHAVCLDHLVTLFYVLNDYTSCLLHIACVLKEDENYVKGLAFRDQILKEQPSAIDHFKLFYKTHDLGDLNAEYDIAVGKQMIDEALAMREARRSAVDDLFMLQPIQVMVPVKPLTKYTWLALGHCLLNHYNRCEDFNINMCCPLLINLREENSSSGVEDAKDDVKMEESNVGDVPVEEKVNNCELLLDSNAASEKAKRGVVDWQSDGTTSLLMDVDACGGPDEETKSRKRRRNSLSFLAQWVWGGKRRSARVRSTVRREAERDECNVSEALRRLVPCSLLPKAPKDSKRKSCDMKSSEDSLDTMDLYKLFENRDIGDNRGESISEQRSETDTTMKKEDYFGKECEKEDVTYFVTTRKHCDVIQMLTDFVLKLSEMWDVVWPRDLIPVFLQAFQIMRQHVPYPSVFSCDDEWSYVISNALSSLLYEELCLDAWFEENSGEKDTDCFERSLPVDTLSQLSFLSSQVGLPAEFSLRLHWLKAHVYLINGDSETAIHFLQMVHHLISDKIFTTDFKVILSNCVHQHVISKESINLMLGALTRNKKLSEVQQLYDDKNYDELVPILKETFQFCQLPQIFNRCIDNCPDRATQLAMLMDALWQLKRYQECFCWGEACCNEALHKYLNSEDKEQQKWASAIEKLLAGLESCITKAGLSVVDCLRLPRLVQNLTHIVSHQLEAPESAVEMPIESVIPWILLQQILQWEEEKGSCVEDHNAEEDLPGYISILFTAHEYLSRRSWCCSNEGALLLHAMDVVIPRMRFPKLAALREKLLPGMEQVFYCLYGHPNKKTKVRSSLQDHSVPQVTLTWERALQLCQFYQPEELPEFDSYRMGSITADLEVLYKRVANLIPDNCNPVLLVDRMNQYIEGELSQVPRPPIGHAPLPRAASSIFYLLGDFYFKNSDWAKAIRHYLLDVCVNPVRLDSWAGMALARGSQLETKLNSCEMLRSEAEFLRKAACTKRCFQRALEIDYCHSLLWIEYGSFVYMMHSFCSRLLKQETISLSLEMFDILEMQREKMLDLAVECFTTANKVWYKMGEDSGLQDERWLHHYMLGKVSEKRDSRPAGYLEHYAKANEFLCQNGASYARRINYNSPQNLAVEALEIFYRIHAAVLKWLEQNEGRKLDRDTLAYFQQCLQQAAEGPFMTKKTKDSDGRGESDEEKLKRPASVTLDDEQLYHAKKICFDQTWDLSVMEDVIDIMEDIIDKVAAIVDPEEFILPSSPLNTFSVPSESSEKSVSKSDPADTNKVSCSISAVIETNDIVKIDNIRSSHEETVKETPCKDDCLITVPKKNEGEISSEQLFDHPMDKEENNDKKSGEGDELVFSTVPSPADGGLQDGGNGTLLVESFENEIEGNSAYTSEDTSKLNLPAHHDSSKNGVSVARRSSLESMTTTTTTETSSVDNSSSSSENESSSSSDDSSESSRSSDTGDSSESDSDDASQPVGKSMISSVRRSKQREWNKAADQSKSQSKLEPDMEDEKKVFEQLVQYCLVALEECVLRFPQHYKSLYRLTHYFFRSKRHRDVKKCRELLLGSYTCKDVPGRPPGSTFQGLFAERKNNNFFNGVWRIPVSEVDRPGSFASHMSRCVSLLMDVLQELRDHRMLLELCLHLRRTPDPDKKYLRDSEREQLSTEALSLALQTLRTKIGEDCSLNIVMDVYRAYLRIQKHLPQKESVFSSLLTEAYRKYSKTEITDAELVVRFCQIEMARIRGTLSGSEAAHLPNATAFTPIAPAGITGMTLPVTVNPFSTVISTITTVATTTTTITTVESVTLPTSITTAEAVTSPTSVTATLSVITAAPTTTTATAAIPSPPTVILSTTTVTAPSTTTTTREVEVELPPLPLPPPPPLLPMPPQIPPSLSSMLPPPPLPLLHMPPQIPPPLPSLLRPPPPLPSMLPPPPSQPPPTTTTTVTITAAGAGTVTTTTTTVASAMTLPVTMTTIAPGNTNTTINSISAADLPVTSVLSCVPVSTAPVPVITVTATATTVSSSPSARVSSTSSPSVTAAPLNTSFLQALDPHLGSQQSVLMQDKHSLSPVKTSIPTTQGYPRPRGRPPGSTKISRLGEDVPFDFSTPKSSLANSSVRDMMIQFQQQLQQQQQQLLQQQQHQQLQMAMPLLSGLASSLPPSLPPVYPLPSMFPDPDLLAASLHSKLDPQMALSMLQAQFNEYQAELLRQLTAAGTLGTMPHLSSLSSTLFGGLHLPQLMGLRLPGTNNSANNTTSPSSNNSIGNNNNSNIPLPATSQSYMKERPNMPNISITPVSQSPTNQLAGSSLHSSSMQQKPVTSTKLVSGSASSSVTVTPPLYAGNQEKKHSTPNLAPPSSYMSFLKNGEGMLTNSLSISQVTPGSTYTSPNKSASKLLNFRKGSAQDFSQDNLVKTSNYSRDTSSKLSSPKSSHRSSSKKSSELKNSSPQKGQSGENKSSHKDSSYKGLPVSPSSQSSSSLRNIGREITVMTASQQNQPGLPVPNRLPQQSSKLEFLSKTKTDTPLSIPSSITITPKQSQVSSNSDSGYRSVQSGQSNTVTYRSPPVKSGECSSAVGEIGSSPPKSKNNPVNWGPVPTKKQGEETKSNLDTDVEVITLE